MRRYTWWLLTCSVLLFVSSAVAIQAARKAMSVQVRQGQVRTTPSFLGKVAATLSYGDRVETLEEKNGWIRVVPPGKKPPGWMHASALSEKRIVLKAGAKEAQQAASGGELALAGKGFNADVEAEFRSRNRAVDYAWIDRMQRMNVSAESVQAFVREGNLAPGKGEGR